MNKKENFKTTQIISFLSGKGGAGKTSVAISVSHLLNDAGFNVLLIDFDFATNGASYFYKYLYASQKGLIGLYDLIELGDDRSEKLDNVERSLLKIKDELCFIPSRVNFAKKMPLRDYIAIKEEDLKSFLLSLINLYKKDFDFIIIDNQAGSNLASKVSASISDKVIIVSELDPISSDTVDTLLIQIGEVFPEYRRHLINKLDIRESEGYKNLSLLFQTMNRLPPLPFDFEVRNAFASRQIPINVDKPTTFLIALFNTVKAFLPEYTSQIDSYGEKILSKFNQYQDKMNSLLDRKKELEEEIETIRKKIEKRKFRATMLITTLGGYLGVGLAILGIFKVRFLTGSQIFYVGIGTVIAMTSSLYFFLSRIQYRERIEYITRKERIDIEMSEIIREIDRYKSLMLTRTKEFLLHFEKSGGSYH